MSAGRTTISLLLLSLVWGQKPPQTLMPPPMPPPQTTSSGIDPCLKENHAVILDEPRRSFNWALEEGSKALCDSHLAPGWYRFQSAAGSSIPTGCPPLDHCGTEYPIWHRGQIPTATEGIVNSIGCGHVGDDCCKVQLPILLKNCSTSVVYFLQPTPSCHMAYCAGYMVPCPRGLVSNTGFTPCQFEVELVGVKVVSNLNSEDHPQIHCIAFLEKVTALDTLLIEVDWLSGGAVIHQQQYHPADYSYAVLPHQFWKLGQTCRARVRHISINTYTPQVTSPPFYAGIQIISRAPIVVQEGGPDVFLELRSTVPVGCHDNNCCIPFKIGVQYPDDTHYCPSGEPLDRLGLKECTHHICKDDWNTTHKIALRSKPDNLYGGNQLLSLEMGSLAHGHSIWSHYKLPSQQVQVAGFDVSERCTSDSYISTFDGQIYSHSLKGSFLFYKNGNHEVEITYSNCTYRRNCNCAVTIRGDHSVIKADICMKGYLLVWSEATYAADEDGDHTHQDVTILQENEGRSYKAVFSSGTIVKLGPYLSYVTVYALRTDLGKTSGLCGLFDRNPSNDLVNENGTPACVYRPRAPCAQYSQRWKVPSGPAAANKTALAQVASMNKYESYCACRKPAKAERNKKVSEPRNENEVEGKEGEDDDEQHCHSSMCEYSPGIEMSEEYLKFAAEQFFSGLENKGLSQSMVVPNEMVPAMYPPSGWNAQTAGIACQRYISGSAAAGLCSNIAQTNLPDRVSECTSDIMVSNNTGWAAVSLNRFKSDCKAELYRNLSLWERTPGGQITTPLRILNSLCVNNCSQNGICKAGVCYCNKEYAGSDCSIQVSEAPVLLGLTSSPCDVYKSSCKFVAVNGREFFEHPHLMCLIEVFLVKDRDDSIMSQGFIKTEGEFLSYQIVICPLPNLDVHSTGKHFSKDSTRALLKVSVCYGLLCATPMDMWIYDSRCWDCTNLTCKPKLPGPCFYYNPYYTPQQ